MINRLWLLAAFATAVCAIAGCGGGSIATTRLPSPTPSSLTPYSISTTIPLPAGAVPVTVALPTPAGGGNVLTGTIQFPAPASPYGANAVLAITASSGQGASTAAVRRSATRGTADNGITVNTSGEIWTFSLTWNTAVSYSSPPTLTVTGGGDNTAAFGFPFFWEYALFAGEPGAPSSGTAYSCCGLSGTLPANQALSLIVGGQPILSPQVPLGSVTVAAGNGFVATATAVTGGSSAGTNLSFVGCSGVATASAVIAEYGYLTISVTGSAPGSCTLFVIDPANGYSTLNVNVIAPPPVTITPTITPSSPLAVSVGAQTPSSFTATQSGYSGAFTVTGCGGFIQPPSVGATSSSGSATIQVTGTAGGTCALTVTGGGGQSAPVSVSVTAPIQPVKASVTSVTVPGAGVAATFTVSQSGYSGAFTTSGCSSPVATATAGTTASNSASITVTGSSAGGTCNLVVTGGQGQSLSIPVSVAVTSVTGS